MADTQTRPYTADDLLRLSAEGQRLELIEGELHEMAPTGGIHNLLTLEIGALIRNVVRAGKLGYVFGAENGFILATEPQTILAPDVSFVSKARLGQVTEKFIEIAPDLAVEVVSPGNSAAEMDEKTALYLQAGARQVWVVYPRSRSIYVYTSVTSVTILKPPQVLEGGDMLPGFAMPLADLFGVLDE